MAVHNVPRQNIGVHGLVLTANTEEIVQFETDLGTVEVLNMDGTAPVYVSIEREAATVGGGHCWVLPAAICTLEYEPTGSDPTTVSLISAGTPTVSVARAPEERVL